MATRKGIALRLNGLQKILSEYAYQDSLSSGQLIYDALGELKDQVLGFIDEDRLIKENARLERELSEAKAKLNEYSWQLNPERMGR